MFNSYGTNTSGGVSIWLKKDFFSQFTKHVWLEFEVGRIACLQLSGPRNNVDISAIYLSATDP